MKTDINCIECEQLLENNEHIMCSTCLDELLRDAQPVREFPDRTDEELELIEDEVMSRYDSSTE